MSGSVFGGVGGGGGGAPSGAAGGELGGNYPNPIIANAVIDDANVVAGGLTNAAISSTAAIAKSKLGSLAIANADVASNAAIAVTKLAGGSDTQVLQMSGSTVQWGAAAGGGGSLTTASGIQSADVTMTTAGTYYDGPSVSCTAGTWFLVGQCFVLAGTTAGRVFTAKLWDGTTATSITSFATQGTAQNSQTPFHLAGIVTPGSTTTYKLSATSSVNSDTLKGTAASLLGWLFGVKVA